MMSLRKRLRVAYDALVKGRVVYNIPIVVNVQINGGELCLQDLYEIEEHAYMGITRALEEMLMEGLHGC